MSSIVIEKRALLVVEGKDWVHFLEHLLREHEPDINSLFQIIDYSSNSGVDVSKSIRAIRIASGFEKVTVFAIVRDSEENHVNTANQTKLALQRNGFPFVDKSHVVHTDGRVRAGYYVVPVGRTGGLESLCIASYQDRPDLIRTKCFIRRSQLYPRSTTAWRHKATAHALIAVSKKPGKPLGASVSMGVWNCNSEPMLQLRLFLRSLVEGVPAEGTHG